MNAQRTAAGAARDRVLDGPIDYLAVEFPGARLTGEGLSAPLDLVSRVIIRVLDLPFGASTSPEQGGVVPP